MAMQSAKTNWVYDIFSNAAKSQTHGYEAEGVTPLVQGITSGSTPVLAKGLPPAAQPVPGPAPPTDDSQLLAQGLGPHGTAEAAQADRLVQQEQARMMASQQRGDDARASRDQYALAAYDAGTDEGMATLEIAESEKKAEAQNAAAYAQTAADQQGNLEAWRKEKAGLEKQMDAAQRKADYLAEVAANSSVHNFWADKSTGARILGIIAQTLSGAANGLAGQPGAESPLDRVMAADFELQKRNLSHKTESAQAAAGALGQIYNSYSNKQQAFVSMQMAMNNMVENQIKKTAAMFKSETATQNAQKALAQTAVKRAELQQQARQLDVQGEDRNRAGAADNLVQMRGQDFNKEIGEQQLARGYIEIPGLIEPQRADIGKHFIEQNARLGGAIAQLDGIENIWNKGGPVLDTWRQTKVGAHFLDGDNRFALGLGANLSGGEGKALNETSVSFLKGRSLEALNVSERHAYFSAIRKALARMYVGRAQSTFGAATPNVNHVLWGRPMAEIQDDEQPAAPTATAVSAK